MDTRPIGVFDSGLGGLTAVRELRRLLPSENIIYFGDTSRVPYGGRSAEILLKYARQDVRFLRTLTSRPFWWLAAPCPLRRCPSCGGRATSPSWALWSLRAAGRRP